MANEITKLDEFKGLLNSQTIRAQVKKCFGDNAGAFLSSMMDLYSNDTYLQTCAPQDVVSECIKAAALKLPIVKSLGFAYVVPYKNKPTFTIGYKGLIQLAQRTGQYKCINADSVYEGELKGFNKLSGEIDLTGEKISDKVIGYFGYIRLTSGFEKVLYMTKEEVEAWARKYSPSYNSKYTPWQTEFDKMAQKTVLRRLIGTYGSMSIEMSQAMEQDDKGATPKKEISEKANKGNEIGFENRDVIEEPTEQKPDIEKKEPAKKQLEEFAGQMSFEADF